MLHDRSRVFLSNSSFDSNKWSGFGCRWSGGGEIRGCTYDSNGQGAWAIRKSTIKDVVRENNTVTNDFTDEQYKQVECALSPSSPNKSVCSHPPRWPSCSRTR